MNRHVAAVALRVIVLSLVVVGSVLGQPRSQAQPVPAWGVAQAAGEFELHNAYGPLRIPEGGKELIVAGDTVVSLDAWVLIRLDAGYVHLSPTSKMTVVERDGRRVLRLDSGGLKYSVALPVTFQMADSATAVIGAARGLLQVAAKNSNGALGVDETFYAIRNTSGSAQVQSSAGNIQIEEGQAVAFDNRSHEVIELAQLGKPQSSDPCAGLSGKELEECEDEDRKAAAMKSGATPPAGGASGGGFSSLSAGARAAIIGGGIVLTAVVANEINDDDEDLASPR